MRMKNTIIKKKLDRSKKLSKNFGEISKNIRKNGCICKINWEKSKT